MYVYKTNIFIYFSHFRTVQHFDDISDNVDNYFQFTHRTVYIVTV